MKYYLEIKEMLTEAEAFTKQPQELRIEVAGEAQAREKLQVLIPVLFSGVKYTSNLHVCRHDDGGACELIELKS